jgi:hypothetical protein
LKDIFVYVIPTIACLALLLVFFGESLIGRLAAVKRLRQSRAESKDWVLNDAVNGREVHDVCEMRLEEVGAPPVGTPLPAGIKHIRFGDIAVIVHYKEKHLRHCAREIGFYAGVSLAVLILAGLWFARDAPTAVALLHMLADNHLVPIVELIMLSLWIIRLGSEVRSIHSLFDN